MNIKNSIFVVALCFTSHLATAQKSQVKVTSNKTIKYNSLTQEQILTVLKAADSDSDSIISYPELPINDYDFKRLNCQRINCDYGENVDTLAKRFIQTGVAFTLENEWETAQTIAMALDANNNKKIDSNEILFSKEALDTFAQQPDGTVAVTDLIDAFAYGKLWFGKSLFPIIK